MTVTGLRQFPVRFFTAVSLWSVQSLGSERHKLWRTEDKFVRSLWKCIASVVELKSGKPKRPREAVARAAILNPDCSEGGVLPLRKGA